MGEQDKSPLFRSLRFAPFLWSLRWVGHITSRCQSVLSGPRAAAHVLRNSHAIRSFIIKLTDSFIDSNAMAWKPTLTRIAALQEQWRSGRSSPAKDQNGQDKIIQRTMRWREQQQEQKEAVAAGCRERRSGDARGRASRVDERPAPAPRSGRYAEAA